LAQILGARVRRLVLIGASAGLATAEERETRLAVDRELADELLRDGLPAFLDRWTRLPLCDSFRDMPAERLQAWQELRSHHDPAALAGALIAMSTGAQPYLLPDLPRLHTPTTLVVGERDAKFRAIARQLAEALPRSEVVVVPGTGHSVPMERPEAIAALLTHKEPVHA